MASTPLELQQLLEVLADLRSVSLFAAAAATWVGFDILVTFPQEVSLIWRTRWSIAKVLYFIVRYYSLLSLLGMVFVSSRTNLSVTVCERWLWYTSFNGPLLSVVVGDSMFIMRLYASYAQHKLILCFIVSVYAVQVVMGIATSIVTMTSLKVVEQGPGSPLTGCIVTNPGHKDLYIAGWILALCATSVYFLLILLKFMHNIALTRRSAAANAVPIQDLQSVSPLIYSFVTDSAVYFLLIFAVHLMNLIFEIVYSDRALMGISTIAIAATYDIAASRLCLSTRQSLLHRQFEYDTGWCEDIEMSDTFNTPIGRGAASPLFANGQVLSSLSVPAFVVHDGGKVSLQRSTFESDSRHELELGGRDKRSESQHTVDDEELMPDEAWVILERPVYSR